MAAPAYISWTGHGSSCGEPPGVFTGATMHMFGVNGDRSAMQAMVDNFLKPVAGNKFTYFAATDSALLTVLKIERCSTSTEVIGWIPGCECALWIPLFEFDLATFKTRMVMWSPYIFISYSIGMVTGREVWGWSKALADIAFPANPALPEFTVSTLIFRQFDASLPGGEETLLTIRGDGPLSTGPAWPSLDDAAEEVIGKLTGLPIGAIPSPFEFVPDFPAIALKQFRDSAAPKLACYQAVVNSPVHITNFTGGGFHNANFTLEIATCASHPIVMNVLGGAPGANSTTVPIQWAGWVTFDFEAANGSVIARTI